MNFIDIEEMRTACQLYQLNMMTENNDADILIALSAAIEETKGYLGAYDTNKIFSAQGNERNPLLVELVKTIALWYIMQKSNVDISFDNVKSRYDRAIEYLTKVLENKISIDLPLKTSDDGKTASRLRYGSNPKFNNALDY